MRERCAFKSSAFNLFSQAQHSASLQNVSRFTSIGEY